MTESSLTEQCQLYPTLCGTSRCQAADRVRREFTRVSHREANTQHVVAGGALRAEPAGQPVLGRAPDFMLAAGSR